MLPLSSPRAGGLSSASLYSACLKNVLCASLPPTPATCHRPHLVSILRHPATPHSEPSSLDRTHGTMSSLTSRVTDRLFFLKAPAVKMQLKDDVVRLHSPVQPHMSRLSDPACGGWSRAPSRSSPARLKSLIKARGAGSSEYSWLPSAKYHGRLMMSTPAAATDQ
jgi:hypothetical protein